MVLRSGPERTVGECLLSTPSLAGLTLDDLRARAVRGEVVDTHGHPVDLDDPARLNTSVFLYRDLPDEPHIPFDLPILYADESIVVVDKPHFLATMPRGRHVAQTALVRLRRQLGTDLVSPAHRLDRLTAGVLLFTLRPEVRSAYQELFATRQVVKEYRALAPMRDDLTTPVTVTDRIEKTAGDLRARVVDGEVNAISEITLIDRSGAGGIYRLRPHTGRTHQLRLHMASLGVGIVGDPLYPDIRPDLAERPDHGDFSQPLRLVAYALGFDDPLTGEARRFESRRSVVDPDG
ncbi:putative pseudouridine synthase [Gordonia rhizosphera NBRC 16068]|uniref:RNA pseudouridylate synthase n=1 Tax=Gordonia rhizosphera NBRC 16068 TaxID=1108045 RepID=K6WIK9_9ACTN|nr:pseudouridine synthase [Gordonia rhizosphera]GAB93631.1 putative pseudouridine synthase [Gordonia rhizosphera NBRC 16068]